MIKIFENTDYILLEKELNEWIVTCENRIHDIQFRTVMNEAGIIFHCCVIVELNLHNY